MEHIWKIGDRARIVKVRWPENTHLIGMEITVTGFVEYFGMMFATSDELPNRFMGNTFDQIEPILKPKKKESSEYETSEYSKEELMNLLKSAPKELETKEVS